jgi:transcriptional regulator GlxA family with amidase domain
MKLQLGRQLGARTSSGSIAGGAANSVDVCIKACKYLIVDSRPSQSAYVLIDHLIHNDPLVERFERWALTRLAQGFSLDEAARAVASSKRTLARRMHAVLGQSPLSFSKSAGGARGTSAEDGKRECR